MPDHGTRLRVYDFGFTAPLPLRWKRSYNSRESSRMGELGYGWSFSYGWSLEARRGETLVLDDAAKVQRFPKLEVGERASNSVGWELARDAAGYRLLGPGRYATEGSQNSVGQWVPGYAPCPPGFSPTQQSG